MSNIKLGITNYTCFITIWYNFHHFEWIIDEKQTWTAEFICLLWKNADTILSSSKFVKEFYFKWEKILITQFISSKHQN